MRIQWLMAQKMREEAAEKERDEHFNAIQPVIPMKQEWRVKEKTSAPTLMAFDDDMDLLDDDESPVKEKTSALTPMAFDDDMDLLDDDESPLIKDGTPPSTSMDINMVFALPAKFKGVTSPKFKPLNCTLNLKIKPRIESKFSNFLKIKSNPRADLFLDFNSKSLVI
jgi:hypothetical protein